MYINSSNTYIKQSYEQSNPINHNKIGNQLPVIDQDDQVSLSQSAKDYPLRAKKMESASQSDSAWVTGKELVIKFGTMALGGEKQLADWKDKGLDVSYETIQAAFQAFQDGFNQLGSRRGGVTINRHEIVKSTQQTPGWFEQEYENSLASIPDPGIKQAFEQGELYYAMPFDTKVNKALSSYQTA